MTQSLPTSIHVWRSLGLWCDHDAKFVSFGIFSSYGLGKFIKSIPCIKEGSIKPTSCLIVVCLPRSEMPPLMTSPEKLSSYFIFFFLFFRRLFSNFLCCSSGVLLLMLSTLDLENSLFLSLLQCYTVLSSLLSILFSKQLQFIQSFLLRQVFWTSDEFP